jgi:hypothetical protein
MIFKLAILITAKRIAAWGGAIEYSLRLTGTHLSIALSSILLLSGNLWLFLLLLKLIWNVHVNLVPTSAFRLAF